jgi:hypothetical protein
VRPLHLLVVPPRPDGHLGPPSDLSLVFLTQRPHDPARRRFIITLVTGVAYTALVAVHRANHPWSTTVHRKATDEPTITINRTAAATSHGPQPARTHHTEQDHACNHTQVPPVAGCAEAANPRASGYGGIAYRHNYDNYTALVMFAAHPSACSPTEMFLAAENAALRTRHKRLPRPYIAVLDELRYGITVPNLPYVASTQRKFGIGYVYAVQSTTQEDAVYGNDAPALRSAAGISLYGGIDIDSAHELTQRAGVTPVVTATRGPDTHTEHIQLHDTLTIGDQQQLADGQATVVVRGLAPFLAWVPSLYEQRSLNRAIRQETDAVAQRLASAQHRDLATLRNHSAATAAGADFGQEGG